MEQNFEALLTAIVADVKHNRSAGKFAFDKYRQALAQPLRYYAEPNVSVGLNRYYAEVATISVLHAIAQCRFDRFDIPLGIEQASEAGYYDWYRLPTNLKKQSLEILNTETPDRLLDQAASWILEHGRRDHLDEFYTPSWLADELVSGLRLDPLELTNSRLIDPACGSGVLLGKVATYAVNQVNWSLINAQTFYQTLDNFFHGFDVQPIAVLLTRLRLAFALLPLLTKIRPSVKLA